MLTVTGDQHVRRLPEEQPPAITKLPCEELPPSTDVEVPTMTQATLTRMSVPDIAVVAFMATSVAGTTQ